MKITSSNFTSWNKSILVVLIFILVAIPTFSSVRLPGVLTSNMVLQRNKEIKVWGWADKGEKVTVQFNNKSLTSKADKEGKWMLVFPPMKEGGPYTMVVKGKNSISLVNILIGDVWICSGQSNMEFVLNNANNSAKEVANANYPQVRLLTIPKNLQYAPVDDIPGLEWKICSPETAGSFSAVGYFFGRDVYNDTKVPIGLINTSWGGTVIEAWTSNDFISRVDEFKTILEKLNIKSPEEVKAARKKMVDGLYTRFGLDPSKPTSTESWSQPGIDLKFWEDMNIPGLWETNGIGEVDGVVWFRREVSIPENLAGKEWILNLGKIDDSDKTFVNGKPVGETEAKYTDLRKYVIIPGTFKPGMNLITVKVIDTGGGGGFWGDKEDMKLECQGTEIPLAGTWKYRLSLESLMVSDSNNPNNIPSCLYNGMISPLLNLAVTGAIWYQGESNASRAYQYRTLFPLMINCWREKWNNPDLNFFFVQLANYMKADDQPVESEWAELREAQSKTLSLPKTGMAVITDIGEANDIHPKNKQDVGYRLALQALKTVYGKSVVNNGPVYQSMITDGNKAILNFDTGGSQILVKDKYGYVKGFTIAGADKKFYWAKAKVTGNQVIVSSDQVDAPVAVRYAWANNPDDANLFNVEGIPASPFRTDDWPGITYNNK